MAPEGEPTSRAKFARGILKAQGPKMAQDCPNIALRWPKTGPRCPKMAWERPLGASSKWRSFRRLLQRFVLWRFLKALLQAFKGPRKVLKNNKQNTFKRPWESLLPFNNLYKPDSKHFTDSKQKKGFSMSFWKISNKSSRHHLNTFERP